MPLEEHTITSACGAYSRKVWLAPGLAEKPHSLYLFLDGEFYLREMQVAPLLAELMERGAIPVGTCAFVSYLNAEARAQDFDDNDAYLRFIAGDVVRWVRNRIGAVGAAGHVICGLSLSGLAGARMALRYPEVFSFALCQSGSFWAWHGKEIELPASKSRFWLSVGDEETATDVTHEPSGVFQEISQIEGVERAAQRLSALGATVHCRRFPGGHAAAGWREDLAPGLTWLLHGASPPA